MPMHSERSVRTSQGSCSAPELTLGPKVSGLSGRHAASELTRCASFCMAGPAVSETTEDVVLTFLSKCIGGCQADGGGVPVGVGQEGDSPACQGGPSNLSWDGDDGLPREQRWAA